MHRGLMLRRCSRLRLWFESERSAKQVEDKLSNLLNIILGNPGGNGKRPDLLLEGELKRAVMDQGGPPIVDTDVFSKQTPSRAPCMVHSLITRQRGCDVRKSWVRLFFLSLMQYREHPTTEASLPPNVSPTIPALFVHATRDKTCDAKGLADSKQLIPTLCVVRLGGVGQWAMIESKEESTEVVIQPTDSHLEQRHNRNLRVKGARSNLQEPDFKFRAIRLWLLL
ncbi:hypothetical protein BOTBODRAFT_32406 [Botryobasidium botryosum FD-172 SS1]|uniref:Uncharacterized protein n=1 Tax=Botryobasidium botryosum (strain FD-172 SS1) TaxID=930990 RepID=A0A067MFQ7_BOTB1|nr:hypothetical protein BOTBODRAFT_32406 [Botryobasidium botryosum FD-172 SS1]